MTTAETNTSQMFTAPITTGSEADRAVAVLTFAFSADPIARWVYPDPAQYLTHWPELVRAFGGRAFEHGTARHAADGAGVALWLPPCVQPDEEALVALAERSMAARDLDEVFALLEQQSAYHPHEPHWYLPLIGVDPARQGQGAGSALLRDALARCDSERTPAFLEATTPRNRVLYERHGFQALGAIQAGSSPPMWPMLRNPR